jgi:transaldolase
MRLFIDSSDINEIKDVDGWGIISGVNITNDALLDVNFKNFVLQVCRIIDGYVSVEINANKTEELIKKGREIASWHPSIIVKMPISEQSIKATKILSSDGIKTNISLIFNTNQALLSALAGATYVSPFIGMDDTILNNDHLISEIKTIYDYYVFDTQIIASGINTAKQVSTAAKSGSDIASVPYKILKQMFKHPFTEVSINNLYLKNDHKILQNV